MKNVFKLGRFAFLWCGFGYKRRSFNFLRCGKDEWYLLVRFAGFGFNFYKFPKEKRVIKTGLATVADCISERGISVEDAIRNRRG